MSIYEIIMLVCFGAAWPFSIYRSLKSRSTQGKSAMFMVILIVGYISGILNKLLVSYDNVVYLYLLNTLMVLFDLLLYFRNKKLEKTNY